MTKRRARFDSEEQNALIFNLIPLIEKRDGLDYAWCNDCIYVQTCEEANVNGYVFCDIFQPEETEGLDGS